MKQQRVCMRARNDDSFTSAHNHKTSPGLHLFLLQTLALVEKHQHLIFDVHFFHVTVTVMRVFLAWGINRLHGYRVFADYWSLSCTSLTPLIFKKLWQVCGVSFFYSSVGFHSFSIFSVKQKDANFILWKKKLPSNRSFWFHPQSFTFYRILMLMSIHILYIHASANPNVFFCYCLFLFFFIWLFCLSKQRSRNSLNIYHILGQQIFITAATLSRMSQHRWYQTMICSDKLINTHNQLIAL